MQQDYDDGNRNISQTNIQVLIAEKYVYANNIYALHRNTLEPTLSVTVVSRIY